MAALKSLAHGCVLVAALSACGDALVEPAYIGEPVYSDPFFVISVMEALPDHPRWAVFWLPDGLATPDFQNPVEQVGTSRRLEASVGVLHLFARPTDELLARTASGGRYGIGRFYVYDDANDNRRRDPDEALIGADKYGIYYAPVALSAADSPTGRALPEGYHRIEFPVPCSRPLAGDQMCDVPLGDACRDHPECGGGVCLQREGAGFPSGMCAAVEETGCAPQGSVRYEFAEQVGEARTHAWLPECERDADCRLEYHCDQAWGTCLRDRGHEIILNRPLRTPVCQQVMGGMPPPTEQDMGMPPLRDGGMPPMRDGGMPPPVDMQCETDEDCANVPDSQPHECARDGICRPVRD